MTAECVYLVFTISQNKCFICYILQCKPAVQESMNETFILNSTPESRNENSADIHPPARKRNSSDNNALDGKFFTPEMESISSAESDTVLSENGINAYTKKRKLLSHRSSYFGDV